LTFGNALENDIIKKSYINYWSILKKLCIINIKRIICNLNLIDLVKQWFKDKYNIIKFLVPSFNSYLYVITTEVYKIIFIIIYVFKTKLVIDQVSHFSHHYCSHIIRLSFDNALSQFVILCDLRRFSNRWINY